MRKAAARVVSAAPHIKKTAEQMALEAEWGWEATGHKNKKKTAVEMAALQGYCKKYHMFPPGVDKDKRRYYKRIFNLGESFGG